MEDEYIRAAVGGTGFAKVGGNYAGGMRATKKALEAGCKEVLWLDARDHKYVEEVGTSNAFFMIAALDRVFPGRLHPPRCHP